MIQGFLFLYSYCWKYNKKYIFYAMAYQVFYALVPLASVIIPRYIINELMTGANYKSLILYISLLVGINFIGSICQAAFSGKMFTEKNVVFMEFQSALARKMAFCDQEQLENPEFLDIKERAHKFLYANGQGFGVVLDSILNIIGKVFVFAGLFTVLSMMSIWVVVMFIGLVLLNSYVESKVQKKYVLWDMEKAPIERRTSYLLGVMEDPGYGKEIRNYGLGDWISEKVKIHLKRSEEFYKKQIEILNRGKFFHSFMNLTREIISYGYLARQVICGFIGIGDFTMYLSALTQFSSAMTEVMKSVVNLKQFSGYYDALEQFINIPEHMRKGLCQEIPESPFEFAFHNVSFTYPGQSQAALSKVSLAFRSGEKLAVVGENGAGKTTFIKLLMRMYDPSEGIITLNGVDIRKLDYEKYQKIIGAVFQDYKLFSFSLRDNVAMKNEKGYEDSKIIDLLETSGLKEKYKKLPKGLDTYINKNFDVQGYVPSGGEGQKIAIARALYKDAQVLVFDEPTAALDPRAEYEIYQKFHKMSKGKLSLFVSHRLGSIHFCDRILVFKNGRVAEQGTHEELIEKSGEYAQLYQMQAEYYH